VIAKELFKQSVSRRGLRSGNTGQRKRQDPEKRKLLEVTEANGASLVAAINRNVDIHREVTEMLTRTQVTVSQDHISYIQKRDSNALEVQRSMVAAISSIGSGLQHLRSATVDTEPPMRRQYLGREMGDFGSERREGIYRSLRRPAWWRQRPTVCSGNSSPTSARSEEERGPPVGSG
jgi:hypothetical protein